MKKHTTGQWRIEDGFIVGDRYVAKIETWHTFGAGTSYSEINKELQEESEANARLMASAPEMLEALKGLYSLAVELDLTNEENPIMHEARKAIKRAEGK